MTSVKALEDMETSGTGEASGGEASGDVTSSMVNLTERVKQLTAHCNVILVNDSLREWGSARGDRGSTAPNVNAVSDSCTVQSSTSI